MESLSFQSTPIKLLNLNSKIKINPVVNSINHQLGIPYFSKQRSLRLSVSIAKKSFSDRNETGFSSSTDGSSPFQEKEHETEREEEEEENNGGEREQEMEIHLVENVTNSGFRLFSQPDSDQSDVLKTHVNGALDEQEEEHEVQGEDGIGKDEHQVREKSDGDEEEDFLARLSRSFTLEQSEVEKEEDEEEEEAQKGLEVSQSEEIIQTLLKGSDIEGDEKTPSKITLNVVFVTSEAAPYSKTGGLGDVCGSLPIALAARGHRVMVVSPRYLHGTAADKKYADALDANCRIKVNCFEGEQEVAFFHQYRAGVDWVFVDHSSYHRPGNPYGDSFGAFGDNQFRFTLLCHAACEAPLVLPLGGYTYGEKCLFLVNDWHAGLVPVLLAAKYRPHGVYKDARSILVIHNLSHQGVEPAVTYGNLGLPPQWYGALEWVFPEWARAHALDKGEAVNILKGAVVTSDRILTVSQGYSWEITTVEGGYGLHELLTSRKFVLNGITNGIDTSDWNPSTDEHIAAHYSLDDLSGKAQCKAALQKELGLPVKPDTPLIGFIGRLDYQKGVDLIQAAMPELMQEDVQVVMLGSGDSRYETWMRETEMAYRDKFRGWVGFNIPISHRITAGCDILLMPSRFEPCGLNQLYAMRYGTIPVVHATGGLRDTVETYNPYAVGPDSSGTGTGWGFSPLTKESMLKALRNALLTYKEYKESWLGLMKRGMDQDFTWNSAAAQYEQVFQWAFTDPPYC